MRAAYAVGLSLSLMRSHAMLLTLLLFVPLPVSAENTVTFGGSSHYPPFHFYNAQGMESGFDVELFREIAIASNWTTSYRLQAWESVQESLQRGDIDVVPMFISDERSALYLFSNPINIEYHLVFGPDDGLSIRNIASLAGYRVAAESGAFATREISRQHSEIIIVGAATEAEALQMVVSGEVDFALLPATIGRYLITTLQLDNIVALSPAFLPASYAFAVTPARPELVDSINQIIEVMERNNKLPALRRQWLYPEQTTTLQEALRVAVWIVMPLMMLTAIMLIIAWRARESLRVAMRTIQSRNKLLKSTQIQARKLYNHDPLTDLPNRKHFTALVGSRLTHADEQKRPLAIGIVTLLNLDTVQDVIGDDAGDELIKKFAQLVREIKSLEQAAYLGAGQFAFLLEDIQDKRAVFLHMQDTIGRVSKDINVAGMIVHTQVCGGLAVYPDHSDNEAELLQKAKLTANNAIKSGAQLLLFSDSMKPDPQKLQLMSDLKTTLADRKLDWALQPQFDVAESRITAFEMLVRWHHPEYGWVPPSDFVVWAEQTGIVGEITNAAIEQACRFLKSSDNLPGTFRLSVNLSANDLADSAMVKRIISQAGRYTCMLTLEITETALMRDMNKVMRNVERLKQAGIKISLDDYGTGYSSLEYLKAFSFDEIKIDRMFINDITKLERNRKLTQASIEMIHNLGAIVVAEGVEDKESADLLIAMGCDVLQGYYLGRPEVVSDLKVHLEDMRQVHI